MSLIKKIKFPNETIYDIGSKWSNIDKESIVYGPSEIVSFENNKIEPLKKCIINIKAVQEGSGDPSSSNIRPITGQTGVTVTRSGKNLLDFTAFSDFANWKTDIADSGLAPTAEGNRGFILPVKPGTYTISLDMSSNFPTYLYLCAAENGVSVQRIYITTNQISNNIVTFQVQENEVWYLRMGSTSSSNLTLFYQQIEKTHNLQLELSSTATSFEPFVGAVYEIDWESEVGTVYGGTLDMLTGVLTVTWASMDIITGGDNGVFNGNQQLAVQAVGKKGGLTNFFSNIFSIGGSAYQMTGRAETNVVEIRVPLDTLNVSASDSSDVRMTAFSAWLQEHPTKLCYELAEPVTYELTPMVISSLLGQNYLWANCGNIFIELENFYSDIQTEITTNLNENTLLYKSNNLLISSNILIENDNLYFSKLNTYSPPQISVSLNSDNKTYRNMDIGWTYSLGNGAVLGLREEHFPNTPGAFFLCARRTLIENENTSILTTQFRGTPEGSITISNNDNTVCLNINTSTSTTINPKDYNLYVNGTSYLKGDTKISANTSTVGCTLQYDNTLNTLNFVFD